LVKEDCITQDVQNALQLFQPESCDSDNTAVSLPKSFELCGLPINTEDKWGINQRIMYRVPWNELVTDEVNRPVLTILSARSHTESSSQDMLNTITGSIVVIGRSYREGYDIYSTPLGDMPGALIIVNAIHSVLQSKNIERSPIVQLSITALFLIFLSIIFGRLSSWWGMTILGILTILVLLPFTMVVFHYGMWFNIGLPLIVVTTIQVIAKYATSD
jgi:CHASE2 domain-containing sensor protein